MIKITCRHCGTEFKVVPSQAGRKFCSAQCAQACRRQEEAALYDHTLNWERDKMDKSSWVCPYATEVTCRVRRCVKCGWNPEEAKRRTEAILKKMEAGNEILRNTE